MSAETFAILPLLAITAGGLLLLVLPWIRSARLLGLITILVLIVAFDLRLWGLIEAPLSLPLFFGMFVQDQFTSFFQLLILASMVLVTMAVMGYARPEFKSRRELYALLLLAALAALILVGADHLAVVYVSLEMISLLSYLLTGLLKKESISTEGALKYFLFGSLATGAFVYGISLVYGLTGTMDLTSLSLVFPQAVERAPFLASVTLFLLVAGLGFKVALVPFHMWAPDAYEGAPTPVTAFLSVVPKLAGFGVLARVFLVGFSAQVLLWPALLGYLAVLTMTMGNVVALVQTNVKRLLAYSSIAHAGTMAIGLAVATPLGLTATSYYLMAYLLMNMGAFLGVIAVGNATGREDIGAFSGLSRRYPALAFMMTVALLSLAGVPPMAGFTAKMWIFGAALEAKAVALAVIAAVNSVVSLFYYVKIIKTMYLDPEPAAARPFPKSRSLQLALAFCTVGLFVIGLWPGRWLVVAGDMLPVSVRVGELPWFSAPDIRL